MQPPIMHAHNQDASLVCFSYQLYSVFSEDDPCEPFAVAVEALRAFTFRIINI